MNHDPMHDVEGLTGALYDGSLGPCRLCEFAAKVRADERNGCIKELENYNYPDEDTEYWAGFEDGLRKSIDLLDMGRSYE